MAGANNDGGLVDALMTFETVGMPARNFAVRTRREYSRDLRELLDYLATCGITDVDMVRLPHSGRLPCRTGSPWSARQ